MARYVGRSLEVVWAYAAGTYGANVIIATGGSVVLSGDHRSFSTSEEVDDVDASAGTALYRNHIPSLVDASAQLQILDTTGTTGTQNWNYIAPSVLGTLYWAPEGTTSGKPKHYAAAYAQTRNRDMPFDDVVAIDVTFQLQEQPTMTTW